MQKNKGIKWGLLAAMLVLALGMCAACANRASLERGTRVIEGYIVDFDGNRVTVDQVEFLTANNTARINALGLDTARDFTNGYYIHNEARTDRKTYTLAENVQVRLSDATAGGWYNGAGRNAAINNVNGYMPSYTPSNSIVGNSTANTGTVNPVQHVGYTLGGTVGGTLGGVEMLNNRFRDGVAVNTQIPYFITIKDGRVTNIEEVYAFSNFAGNGYGATTNYPNTTTNYPNTNNYPNANNYPNTTKYPTTNNYPSTQLP